MSVYRKIYEAVQSIPKGRVMTYGQVAALAGNPGLARVVGNALHVNPAPGVIPCHRVVNRQGALSGSFAFGGSDVQRHLLEAEGVVFLPDGRVDMARFCVRQTEAFGVDEKVCGKHFAFEKGVLVMYQEITAAARKAVDELLEVSRLSEGDLFVVGCSSSEVGGSKIGTGSSMEIAAAVLEGIYPRLQERGLYLAAQCCEHLNRCIILERAAAEKYGLPIVNVLPQPKAGGSFATTAWQRFTAPVAVESVQAGAGLDIGGTLIGMHLRPVAVPVRLSLDKIGEARILCARTRPKFIGGCRAVYDEGKL